MLSEYEKEEAIFRAALGHRGPGERAAYLQEACAGNTQLLSRIQALLKAHDDAAGFLDGPLVGTDAILDMPSLNEGPGTTVGRYRLLEKIGEGGMAVVYMAEQAEPLRRKVALKIIKLGMDTRQVIARFEAERQALAMMDHPNIAKVFDAGTTDTGRPYFVMELVTGVSITEYCDKNSLGTRERLGLFVQVCHAVHHAHQKGIIHRDVKPSNVMVTMHDGQPVPKVIDFGIAKATNQRLTEKTLFTRYAHIIGTPAYMSPEQAELSDVDIDTRSDVYSLGVLLYELLTGTTPFGEEELRKAGYLEMQRIIREEEPTKPSTKLSTLGVTLTEVARHRQMTPSALQRLIRGDLDWIVMKSLEKTRSRRYDTAAALGLDVRRHLNHEPVLARAPKAAYRLEKFLRRHRTQAVPISAIAILISAGTVSLMLWYQNRARLAETEFLRHQDILFDAREAHAQADQTAALEGVLSILDSPYVGPEARLLHAGILVDSLRYDEAVAELEDLVHERPEIAGAAHSLWARMLWESRSPQLGTPEGFVEHRQWAEELLPETAEAYFLRAMTAFTIKDKLELLDRALELNSGHYASLRLRAFTYFVARKYGWMREDARVMAALRPGDPLGYSLRASALQEQGYYEEAVADYDRAIQQTREEDARRARLQDQRCDSLLRMGDYRRALEGAEEGLKLAPKEATLHFRRFCALTALGDYDAASASFYAVVELGADSVREFRAWSMKYVLDTMAAGQAWHPLESEPEGAAFVAMLEAEGTYGGLSAKASRLIKGGFSCDWSADGSAIAFSLGVPGYSGIAVFDLASGKTNVLIAPGRDPKWSPDGQHIAFVRDCLTLHLSELADTGRRMEPRSNTDEYVWIMKTDGTDPRSLGRGSRPSWSPDSKLVYAQSRRDRRLRSISIEDTEAVPEPLMTCFNYHPTVSPDGLRVALVEQGSLTIKDIATQSVVAEWAGSPGMWGATWSATGRELSLGGVSDVETRTGLWIYDVDRGQAEKVLSGQVTAAHWTTDGTRLALTLGAPYYEIWVAELDGSASTVEALGPGRTLEEHYQEMVRFQSDKIAVDDEDADSYFRRAQYYKHLHEDEKSAADMARYVAIVYPWDATNPDVICARSALFGLWQGTARNLGSTVNSPAHDGAPSISTDGLSLFFNSRRRDGGHGSWDLWVTSRATTEDAWGTPKNLGPLVNSPSGEGDPSVSADSLVLLFNSNRTGGHGDLDLWVTRRETAEGEWGVPENLRSPINSSYREWAPELSRDGCTLYFCSDRPGGDVGGGVWIATRVTPQDDWENPVQLGPAVNSPAAARPRSVLASSPYPWAGGMALFFDCVRAGGCGGVDLWVTMRTAASDGWDQAVNLGPAVNSLYNDVGASMSADSSTLYFCSDRPNENGGWDLWEVRIGPPSDARDDEANESTNTHLVMDSPGIDGQ